MSSRIKHFKKRLMAVSCGFLLSTSAFSAPPHWAPAHGYKQHTPAYSQGNQFAGFDNDMLAPLIGAAVGGLLGSQIGGGKGKLAATAMGTVIGYVLGGKLRDYMDQNDRNRTYQALESHRNYQTANWVNPDTQARYQVTPVATYESRSGVCRDFVSQAFIDGYTEEVTGTACRTDNGHWRIQ